jgi:hypothetical protein
MRKRHKNDLEVDLIGCPNPTAHKGRCGKCLFDRASKNYASRYRVTKSTYSSPATTNEELFLSSEYQVSNSHALVQYFDILLDYNA